MLKVGDRVIINMKYTSHLVPFGQKDPLTGKEGIISRAIGGDWYRVFVPEYPPCFMDPGDSETDWLLYETEIELVK